MKLGASVSGFFDILYQEAIDALGASTIQTFELSPKVFFRRTMQDEFNAMLRDTGKKAASYHIPYGLGFDISRLDESIRREAVQHTVSLLDHAAFFNYYLSVIYKLSVRKWRRFPVALVCVPRTADTAVLTDSKRYTLIYRNYGVTEVIQVIGVIA